MRPLLLILLFALIIISQINTIVDNDLWLHFRAGEYAVKNLSIPVIDIFSYTLEARPWIHYDWLSEVLFYIAFINFGWLGLNILKALIIALCFFILYLLTSKGKKLSWGIFFIILSILAFGYRSFVRPEIFSYLALCIFLYILERGKPVYFLSVVEAAWVNLHGYFVIGPLLVFLYFIGGLFNKDKIKMRKLLIGLILVIGACFINPYFYKGILYPVKIIQEALTGQKLYIHDVQELMMPIRSSFMRYIFFWALAILASLTFLINLKKAKITHALVFLVSFLAAYSATRYMPLFIFIAMPIAAINMNEANLKKVGNGFKPFPTLTVAMLLTIYFFISNSYYRFTSLSDFKNTGSSFSMMLIPKGACDFLEKNNIKGRMFNTLDFGPYIAYRFYPEKRIFIDTRIGLYKEDFYGLYRRAQNYPEGWKAIQEEYGFDIALLRHLFGGTERILRYLYTSQDWSLAYYDQNSAVFLRNMPQYRIGLSDAPYSVASSGSNPPSVDLARFYEKIGETKLAEEIYIRLLDDFAEGEIDPEKATDRSFRRKARPASLEAAIGLAEIYINTKRFDQALNLMFKFLRYFPKTPELYASIGTAYLNMGMEQEGIYMLERASMINPYLRSASYMLGLAYLKQGETEKALRQFIKYERLDPFNSDVHRLIGNIYKQKGLFKKARLEYNEADALDGK